MTHNRMHTWFTLKKVIILAGVGLLLLLLLVLVFLLRPAYSLDSETRAFIQDAVAQQQKIEKELRAYYQAGNYTFTDPLVVQNPYQAAPLTALLIFDTTENSQISIHVPGKTPQAAVDFTFAGYQKHHEIPVYGLYADMLNHVMIRMETQNGESAQTEIDLQTEPLPVYMQVFQVDKVNPDKYSPGFNFAFSGLKPVFDLDGNVRWYSTRLSFLVFSRLNNGRYLFTYSMDDQENNPMMEQDLLGKIYTIYHVTDGIHHDVIELPNGNLLVTSSDLKSDTVEDYILELDRSSGYIVRSFDMKKYLDVSRPLEIGKTPNDWLHMNSIIYDPIDKTIIFSNKSQSAVIKMTYPGMQIKWILGPHDNWRAKFQPYLLTPVGEKFEWSWSQHHATLFGPNLPGDNSLDLLLFDNGLYRSFDLTSANSPLEWYSRVVHYRINEASMTIEQVWEYGKERGASTFAGSLGSAYLLSNNDVLGTWGAISKDAQGIPMPQVGPNDTNETKIIEVNPSTNEIVFECTIADSETYRTLRAGFYDGYSEENNYLYTSLNDTSENDLVDRSIMAWYDVKRWSYSDPTILSLRRFGRRILGVIR
jgi:arylsulfate sulfotransferase